MSVLTLDFVKSNSVAKINLFRGGCWAYTPNGKAIRFNSLEVGVLPLFQHSSGAMWVKKAVKSAPSVNMGPMPAAAPKETLEQAITRHLDELIAGDLLAAMIKASETHAATRHDPFGDFRDLLNKKYPEIGQKLYAKALEARGIAYRYHETCLTHNFKGTIKRLKTEAAYTAATTSTLGSQAPRVAPVATPKAPENTLVSGTGVSKGFKTATSPASKAFSLYRASQAYNREFIEAVSKLNADECDACNALCGAYNKAKN